MPRTSWDLCRVCGDPHQNPQSTSLCPRCGKAMREERQAREAAEEARTWDELDWEERYDRDKRRAFMDLVYIVTRENSHD